MSDYDCDDPFDLDAMQQYALTQAIDWMIRWEDTDAGKTAVAAANAYATIALAAGHRLQAIGGIPEREPALCADCNEDVTPDPPEGRWQYYMVLDRIWQQAGLTPEGFLCLDCLETRLGRPLTGGDFDPDIPINRPHPFDTPRMAELKQAAALRKEQSA